MSIFSFKIPSFPGVKLFVGQIMKDVDGKFSFKRSTLAVILALYVTTVIVSLKFIGIAVDHAIIDSLKQLMMVGLGVVGAEKFTGRNTPDPDGS